MANPLVRAARLVTAARRAVVVEYRRQQHPERGWFYYARIGSSAADGTLILPRQSGKDAAREADRDD